MLEYREDFEQVRVRWDTFWRGNEGQRPLLNIVVPKANVAPERSLSPYACGRGPLEDKIAHVLRYVQSREYLAEAVPLFLVTFAPDHFAALLGSQIRFDPSTSTTWVDPFVEDWDETELRVQWEGQWWQRTVECIRAFRKACDGKLIIVPTHLQGGLDCLSAIRGPEQLAMDLVTEPEKIHRALRQVDSALSEVVAALRIEHGIEKWGTVTRHGMYHRGFLSIPSCDFSCMISEGMFNEFGLPSIAHEAKQFDMAEYHLDGPGAVRHLEAICAIPEIAVIQWQPGEGQAANQDWGPLYRRIDELGKGQCFLRCRPELAKRMVRELKGPQLFFDVVLETREEAMRFIDEIEEIWAKRG